MLQAQRSWKIDFRKTVKAAAWRRTLVLAQQLAASGLHAQPPESQPFLRARSGASHPGGWSLYIGHSSLPNRWCVHCLRQERVRLLMIGTAWPERARAVGANAKQGCSGANNLREDDEEARQLLVGRGSGHKACVRQSEELLPPCEDPLQLSGARAPEHLWQQPGNGKVLLAVLLSEDGGFQPSMALAYKVVSLPHLGMSLEIGAVYTTAELELRCGGTKARQRQLAKKLENGKVFKPVSLHAALNRKRKRTGSQPQWVRPPQARHGRAVDEDPGRRRRIAERLAGQLLEKKQLLDADLLLVLKAWATHENKIRKNVKRDGQAVYSDTFGLVNKRTAKKAVLTSLSKRFPNMTRLLTKWLRQKTSTFPFTSISLNINYRAKRHRDKNNSGPSAIAAVGPFQGGELLYWPRDDKSSKVETLQKKDAKVLNIKKKMHFFDGTCAHEVRPFRGGERFSLVYFTVSSFCSASKAVRRAWARATGERDVPTAQSLQKAMARC
ncbi:DNA-directed RNA polymerases I and III subunit RPAC1 [Durusdinium trenchii]|uniref:DNA-directed RNA polymerases I and III subunit RPAC1 n=1 Tax=Durusdinium trenchii TaxID=1381693 RepID=A0ABP0K2K2_9DINO